MADEQNTQTTLDHLARARSLASKIILNGLRHHAPQTSEGFANALPSEVEEEALQAAGSISSPAPGEMDLVLETQDARALETVLNHLRRERSLDGSVYKQSFLLRRLAVRMKARGALTLIEYAHLLRSDRDEEIALLNALSINLSYFFRDEQVFDGLRWAALEPLIAQRSRNRNRTVTVWSAGCANGEEPYSIAMIITDLLGRELPHWKVQIHGTDVDEAALARARRAVYGISSFRNPQAAYVHRFFVQEAGHYTLRPEVRRLVCFVRHDVHKEPILPQYDLITCRNVLIYLTRKDQNVLIRHLLQHLSPGGHLILGGTEMLPLGLILTGHVEAVDGRLRIYRKPFQKRSTRDDMDQARLDVDL
jgi:chemotaxis methyl-accepting protein methylase